MSLDWNVSNIENYRDKCYIEDGVAENGEKMYRLNGTTEALIWSTMLIDMGEITEKNAQEFYSRIHIWEALNVPMIIRTDSKGISPKDVYDHIGLKTNVNTTTFAKWRTRVMKSAVEDAGQAWRKEMNEVAV